MTPGSFDQERPDGIALRWADALMCAQLFAIDPTGLCGIAVRSGSGPTRDRWMDYVLGLLAPSSPVKRLPSGIADDRLLGGVDLTATLKSGRPVVQKGILAEADGGVVVIPMAERLSAGTASRIVSALDRGEVLLERDGLTQRIPTAIGIIALDEGAGDEEQMPAALAYRLAFHLDLRDIPMRGFDVDKDGAVAVTQGLALLASVQPADDSLISALVAIADDFGVDSVVGPLMALRTARAVAALAGRVMILEEDAVLAARLVLAPRATRYPRKEEDAADPPEDSADSHQTSEDRVEQLEELQQDEFEDVVRAAVEAALPERLLEKLKCTASDRLAPSRGHGTGASKASFLRGRPIGVRMGPLKSGARLALVDTLRAAAPWQTARRAQRRAQGGKSLSRSRIDIRREDFRIKAFAQRRESTIVFCVDASGSAAFHRLAEAKGAVELLLGEAYVARTYAALIAFRGVGAELLLPPSRSLTRAKAMLAVLPGGGGTPLAAGIDAALSTAIAERSKGRTPLIVFLTDGQANITRDGKAVRARGFDEALLAARQIGEQRLPAIFVDTSPRTREEGPKLAQAMAARYLALPNAQAAVVRDFVRAAAP